MNTRKNSIGFLIRYLLYHERSIEERLAWSSAINGFIQQDKYRINRSIQKVKSAIEDVLAVVRDPVLVRAIRTEINKPDLANYMELTEQLFDLNDEDLAAITDLITYYLNTKYGQQQSTAA